jgi:hypothetical protein
MPDCLRTVEVRPSAPMISRGRKFVWVPLPTASMRPAS